MDADVVSKCDGSNERCFIDLHNVINLTMV